MIKTEINVKNIIEATHQYVNAPAEVDYLRNPHRHMLHIYTTVEVFDDDRELEFIKVKHAIQDYLQSQAEWNGYAYNMGTNSCEMLARELLGALQTMYGLDRDMQISIYEDDENGSTIKYFS
jgi:flagellar biosynthesis component FlhA